MDTPRKHFLPGNFNHLNSSLPWTVCVRSSLRQPHMPNDPKTLEFVSLEGNTHLSARPERNRCWRDFYTRPLLPPSLSATHPLLPPHLSSREKFIRDEGRNHLQVCTEDHVPAEIRTCTKRSSPSNKVTSIQRSIKYLWAGNPLLIIPF